MLANLQRAWIACIKVNTDFTWLLIFIDFRGFNALLDKGAVSLIAIYKYNDGWEIKLLGNNFKVRVIALTIDK